MKGLFRSIFRIVFLIIFVLFCFAGIDYYRMTKGLLPVFQTSQYNSRTRVQTFHGTFYTASRKVRANPNELLEESSDVSYSLFQFPISLTVTKEKKMNDFKVVSTVSDNCSSKAKLIYADLNTKVYTVCLEDIQIDENGNKTPLLSLLKKDSSIIDDLKSHMGYMGMVSGRKIEQYDSRDGEEIDIRLFQCNLDNVNDLYIGSKDMNLQNDFCTLKDDDLPFLFEIKDEAPTDLKANVNEKGETIHEVFYEDEAYRYQFEVPKSNYVFVVVPANRGRGEKRYSLMDVIHQKLLTMEQLAEKGLSFEKVDKTIKQDANAQNVVPES